MKNECKILVWQRQLVRPKCTLEVNMKVDLKEKEWKVVALITDAQYRPLVGSCGHDKGPFGSIKVSEFDDCVSNYKRVVSFWFIQFLSSFFFLHVSRLDFTHYKIPWGLISFVCNKFCVLPLKDHLSDRTARNHASNTASCLFNAFTAHSWSLSPLPTL
jgi:hypothetical protein